MGEAEQFDGGIFDASLEGGRAAAVIRFRTGCVEARVASGPCYELPYAGLRIELGGHSGRVVFLRGAAEGRVIFSEAKGFLEAVRERGGMTVEAAHEAVTSGINRDRRRGRGLWLIAAVVLAGLVWLIPLGLRAGVDGAVASMPKSVDAQLGELAAMEISRTGPTVDDPRAAAFAQEVVDKLVAVLPPEEREYAFKITVVENAQVNAFALPGGRMALLTGLLKRADNADMVAAVIAHEISHVTKRHGLRHMVRSLGVVAGLQLLLGDVSGVAAVLAQGATLAVITNYSRDHESEADAVGMQMLAKAGFDPAAMPAFFEKLKSLDASEMPKGLEWISTHPDHDSRIAALRALLPTAERGKAAVLKNSFAEAKAAVKGD
ncbi:MAG: M48 family metallopeptidase [Deltaproteobacteria bacterium]|nr:M48 family metallopeptidase [Deltaproteobacteria bacterium]